MKTDFKKHAYAIVFFALFLSGSLNISAQVIQSERFEREQKNRDEFYTVISMEEEGLVLLRDVNKYNGNKKLWEVIFLDTALQQRKVAEVYMEERYPLIGYEVNPGKLYLLFRSGDTNKNSFHLVEVDAKEGIEVSRNAIKPEVELKITHFTKAGSGIVLGGYVSNDPAIILCDLISKSIRVVPGFFQKDNELVDLRANENQTFNVVLIDRSQRAERKLVFKTFDETGKMLLEDIVPIDDDKSLQTSITSTLKREDMMILGTWGEKTGRQAVGFFSLPIQPFAEQKIQFYSFGELEHFLDYMNPKRAARIKENTAESIKSGRGPSFTSYVMPYKIEETKDGYFLLAEVYNPLSTGNPYYNNPATSYYANPYSYYSPFWPGYYPGMRYRPYPYGNTPKNSEEIKTYSTVLVSFDGNGKLLWDQSVKLDDVEKPAVEQVADFVATKTHVYFVYKKESELKIKSIDLREQKVTDSTQEIKMLDDNDELRNELDNEGGIRKWNDKSFFVWGYQTIRNTHQKGDRVRDVFYINKIIVQPQQ
jgi:hypothetical protein